MIDADYPDEQTLFANIPAPKESLLPNLEQVARDIGICVNTNKIEYICFKQKGTISTLSSQSLKLVDQFIYRSSILSTETDVNIHLVKAWNTTDRLLII